MTIPEADVELVAQHCNVGMDLARQALQHENDDLAAAVTRIENENILTHEELATKNRRAGSDVPEGDDVKIVAQRADVPRAKAHDVLRQNNGDLVAAFEVLTQENSSSHNSTTKSSKQSTGLSTDESTSLYNSKVSDADESTTKLYSPDSTASGPSPQTTPKYCPHCGKELVQSDTANFCSHCGRHR